MTNVSCAVTGVGNVYIPVVILTYRYPLSTPLAIRDITRVCSVVRTEPKSAKFLSLRLTSDGVIATHELCIDTLGFQRGHFIYYYFYFQRLTSTNSYVLQMQIKA